MAILLTLAGLALLVVILADGFAVMVLPRRVQWLYRPARLYYRATWALWRLAARRLFRAGKRREAFLSLFGPLSMLGLFAGWVSLLIVGYGLLHYGLGTPLAVQGPDREVSLTSYLYLSGETFFTLGYGDLTAREGLGRFLTVFEAGMGFGFLAVIIGYLPVLYQAFSRREVTISMLDARAGSPPTAGQLLERLAHAGNVAAVGPFLVEWERWAGELLESHISFPVLSYYRSQHNNQSWLAALAAMMDTCAFLIAAVRGVTCYQAQLTFAMARHAVVDLAMVFHTPPLPPEADRLPAETLRDLQGLLRHSGLEVRTGPEVAVKLAELRVLYEPFVNALARYFLLTVPAFVPDKPPVDNWQTSAWTNRAAGLTRLSALDARDDHL